MVFTSNRMDFPWEEEREMVRTRRCRLLSNMVLKDAGNISLVRHGASQRNQDKCAPTFVHAFILVGQTWQKHWLVEESRY